MLRRILFVTSLGIGLMVSSVGCRPGDYRRDADRVSYDIIRQKQQEALGRTEAFSIERPADTLRRRLLLDQELPYADKASLGARDITPIKQWPDGEYLESKDLDTVDLGEINPGQPLLFSLTDALQIAARESREYQAEKELVFQTALRLDLERDAFRGTWTGVLEGLFQSNLEQQVLLDDQGHTDLQTVSGLEYGPTGSFSQRFKNGMSFTGQLGLDMVSMLTQDRLYSRGVFADVSVTMPLLRGAGRFVVTEPLTQAERNVVYAIYNFERFKRRFAVDVATEYLSVLRLWDSVENAEDNYRRLISSTRRAQRLATAGRLPEIQVDQSRQDELRARNQWVSAQASYQRQLDAFKLTLGLPTDAPIELDRGELAALSAALREMLPEQPGDAPSSESAPPGEQPAAVAPNAVSAPAADDLIELSPPGRGRPGRFELVELEAIITALTNRLDLRVAVGRLFDSQRTVAVAADQLRADLTLLGRGSAGARRTLAQAAQRDSILRPDEGQYSVLMTLDLPFERTAERNVYRSSLIQFEQAVRDVQALEDQIKLEVRNDLSRLLEAREGIQIQAEAVKVARRRVESTNLFLEAGRAEIRDVLEAQDALVTAQNALTAALINYRVGELNLQRDLDVLVVDETGLWREYEPENGTD